MEEEEDGSARALADRDEFEDTDTKLVGAGNDAPEDGEEEDEEDEDDEDDEDDRTNSAGF